MLWHVGSDDPVDPVNNSCRVAGEDEGLMVVRGGCEGVRELPAFKDQKRST